MAPVCWFPWTYVYFSVDGGLGWCCLYPQNVANINKINSLDAFWNSRTMQHVRSLFLAGKYIEGGCHSGCHVLNGFFPENMRNIEKPAFYDPAATTGDAALDAFPVSPFDRPSTFEENQALIRAEIEGRYVQVKSYPTRVHLETNSFCNLKCPMCYIGQNEGKIPNVRLSDASMDKLKELYPFLEYIEIQGGESIFGNPPESPLSRVLSDIEAARNPNMECLITTNAIGLNKRWTDFILDRDVATHLTISVDTVNPEVYPIVRKGGRLDILKRHLAHFVNEKERRGRPKPKIVFACVLSTLTAPDITDLDAFAQEMGATWLSISPLLPVDSRDTFFAEHNLMRAENRPQLEALAAVLPTLKTPSNQGTIAATVKALLHA